MNRRTIIFMLLVAAVTLSPLGAVVADTYPLAPLVDFSSQYGPSVPLVIRKVNFQNTTMNCGSIFDAGDNVRRGCYDLLFAAVDPKCKTEGAYSMTITSTSGTGFAFVSDTDPSKRLPVTLCYYASDSSGNNINDSVYAATVTSGTPFVIDPQNNKLLSHFHVMAYATNTDDSGKTLTSLPSGTYSLSFTVSTTKNKTNVLDVLAPIDTYTFTVSNTKSFYINCVLEQELTHINLNEFYKWNMNINTSTESNSSRANDVKVASLKVESNIPYDQINGKNFPKILFIPLNETGTAEEDIFSFHNIQHPENTIPFSVVKNIAGSGQSNRQWYAGKQVSGQSSPIEITWKETGKSNNFLQSDQWLYITPNAGTVAEYNRDKGEHATGFVPGTYVAWIKVEVTAPEVK